VVLFSFWLSFYFIVFVYPLIRFREKPRYRSAKLEPHSLEMLFRVDPIADSPHKIFNPQGGEGNSFIHRYLQSSFLS
jgi:hypothetical protein